MVKFEFGGHLRRYFSDLNMSTDSISRGLRILFGQDIEFRKAFTQSQMHISINNQNVHPDELSFHFERTLPDNAIVKFTPVVEGAIAGGIATWVVVGLVAASIALSLYTLFKTPNKPSSTDAQSDKITNNSFSSAENLVGQGRPVPILLGEMVVGSNVISLGIDTSNNQDWDISIS